jgi:hypothetical protein
MIYYKKNFCLLESKLLSQAEKLHKDALRLARISFGEDNVQTAKHYGNLGRLYQSMKRYDVSIHVLSFHNIHTVCTLIRLELVSSVMCVANSNYWYDRILFQITFIRKC